MKRKGRPAPTGPTSKVKTVPFGFGLKPKVESNPLVDWMQNASPEKA